MENEIIVFQKLTLIGIKRDRFMLLVSSSLIVNNKISIYYMPFYYFKNHWLLEIC